ncbi:MAG: hypothetical protein AAF492_11675, partial [Verrucomicrobiota bacterium]
MNVLSVTSVGGTHGLAAAGDISVQAGTQTIVDRIVQSTGGGDIELIADMMAINSPSGSIVTLGGEVSLFPATPGTTIGLGGAPGTFNLDTSELGTIVDGAGRITIGAVDSGTVRLNDSTFTDPVRLLGGSMHLNHLNAGMNDVTLGSSASISDTNGGAVNITAGLLTADAVSGIDLDSILDEVTLSVTGPGGIDLFDLGATPLDVNDVRTFDGPVSLTADSMVLQGLLTAGGLSNIISLTTRSGGIDQTMGMLRGFGLEFNAAGPVTLDEPGNNLDIISGIAAGAINIVDTNALIVGMVVAQAGLNSLGNPINILTGGPLTFTHDVNAGMAGSVDLTTTSGDIAQAGGALTAGSLSVNTPGSADLSQSGNDIGTVAASVTGAVNIVDMNTLTVGTVNGLVGVVSGSNIVICAHTDLIVNEGILSVDGANIVLSADDMALNNTIETTGEIFLLPKSVNRTIGLGGASGDFNLSTSDIANLMAGATRITIGNLDSGTVNLDDVTFVDAVRIRGGEMNLDHLNAGSEAVTLISQGSINDDNGAVNNITAGDFTATSRLSMAFNTDVGTIGLRTTDNGAGISVTEANDIVVREIAVNDPANDSVTIMAPNGMVSEDLDPDADVRAHMLTIDAESGIDVDTDVNIIDFNISVSGDIRVDESDGLVVTEAVTGNGNVTISAGTIGLAGPVGAGVGGAVLLTSTNGNIN